MVQQQTMTHRFVKIGAGSERFEIRRYKHADEGINLNGVQQYWVGITDQRAISRVMDHSLLRTTKRVAEPRSQASQPDSVTTGG